MKKFYAVLALCACLSSCGWDPFSLFAEHYYDVHVTLRNNSETVISYVVSNTYPDTTVISDKPERFYPIKPGGESKIPLNPSISTPMNWKRTFPHDTLILFVFDNDVIENCSWNTIREDYLILKRFDLSEEDLEHCDWTITYP